MTKTLIIHVTDKLKCPTCGNGELHPDGDKVLIRSNKVSEDGHWWSQCLVCSHYYDEDLNVIVNTPEEIKAWRAEHGNEGWF